MRDLKKPGDMKKLKNKYNPLLFQGIQKIKQDNVIPVTYDVLMSGILNEELIKGQLYEIIDYETKFILGNTDNVIVSGGVEKLVVQALSNNKISNRAYSSKHPDDIIGYNPYICNIEDESIDNYSYFEYGVDDGSGDFFINNITSNSFDINVNPTLGQNTYVYVEDSTGNYQEFYASSLGNEMFVRDNGNGTWKIKIRS